MEELKPYVSVKEMAALCGLSRSRFYDLIGTAFPEPLYEETSGRPYYDQSLQRRCIEARATNRGLDSRPIVFYTPRRPMKKSTRRKASIWCCPEIAEVHRGLKSMGLTEVTPELVEVTLRELFPDGVKLPLSEVLKHMFLALRRKSPERSVNHKT